jgi:hypothetical protein
VCVVRHVLELYVLLFDCHACTPSKSDHLGTEFILDAEK